MHVSITVKQAGSRKDALSSRTLTFRDGIGTLRELIAEVVILCVREYNGKSVDADLVGALTKGDIASQAQTGKVGFLRRIHRKNADTDEAVRNALQCFEDGLFRVFVDGQEIAELDQKLVLQQGAGLVFVRMTMLAGRMW